MLEALLVGIHVGDGALGNSRLGGGLDDGAGNSLHESGVEGRWNDIFATENELTSWYGFPDGIWNLLPGEGGDGLGSSHLHFLVDLAGSAIKSSSEQEWEAHDVIDLVGVVRSAGSYDTVRPVLSGNSWNNFWVWIGHSKDDWVFVHTLDNCFGKAVG